MVEELARSRLGRGLAALIGDVDQEFPNASSDGGRGQKRVPIEFLRRNAANPRIHFDETDLDELAGSIRERGIIQPIVVRPFRNLADAFEIVAGERRWRAAQRAGLHEVPVVVVEADDKTALELAIIENVQRRDLNALEEAAGYENLIAQYGYSQTDLATTLGKSRSHIANTLRLLKLPEKVRDRLAGGEISAGHARALLSVKDPEVVAERIAVQGLTVRDVERIAQNDSGAATPVDGDTVEPLRRKQARKADADTRAVETALEDILGMVVRIDDRDGKGELRIRYRSLDQLDALCRRLRMASAA